MISPSPPSGAGRTLAATLVAFGVLYNISFLALPPVTTGRVAVLAVVLLSGRALAEGLRQVVRVSPVFLGAMVSVAGYAAAQLVLRSSDTTQLSRLVNFLFFALVAPMALLTVSRDYVVALRAVFLATLIQTAFVGVAYLSPEFRYWTSTALVQGGNIPLVSAVQVAGFSNSSGAALSVVQGLGTWAAVVVAMRCRHPVVSLLHLAGGVVIAMSCLLIGRTGLAMATLSLALGLATRLRPGLVVSVAIALSLLGGAFIGYGDVIVEGIREYNEAVSLTLERAYALMSEGFNDPSVQELTEAPIPPLTTETLIGTGRVGGNYGNAAGHDSGYVQTYYSLGLVVATLFYVAMVAWWFRWWRGVGDSAMIAGLLFMALLIEIKEPFLFKFALPFVLSTALIAGQRPSEGHS